MKDSAVFVLLPPILFLLMQSFVSFPLGGMEDRQLVFSLILSEALAWFLFLLIGSGRAALMVMWLFFGTFGLLESYIFDFRGSYITAWDIFSVGTALSVAGNYSFVPSVGAIRVMAMFACCLIPIAFCNLRIAPFNFLQSGRDKFDRLAKADETHAVSPAIKMAPWHRWGMCAVFLALLVSMAFSLRVRSFVSWLGISDNLFHSDSNNEHDGVLIRLLYETQWLFPRKPEGYNAAEEAAILAKYEAAAASAGVSAGSAAMRETAGGMGEGALPSSGTADGLPADPDVIVIMSESFADPRVDGDFEVNRDYMSFVHSLMDGEENAVSGILNVSVLGGNTPNTEFEFLTGHSLAFLPKGSIPYQQYVRKPIEAMPSYFKEKGYYTIGMHPYESKGWDRDRVYPLLGFDEIHFLDYFEERQPEYVRKYVSDDFFLKEITRVVREAGEKSGKSVFSFNVTMQNHGGYGKRDYDNFNPGIRVIGSQAKSEEHIEFMENYLSLIELSDKAFRDFVDSYRDSERPTIIAFFGDHQPALVNLEPIFANKGKDRRSLDTEEEWDTYKVPFAIWANFDIEEAQGLELSANYLGNLLLKEAGMNLSGYRLFTEEFQERYPVLSAVRAENAAGESRDPAELKTELSEYAKLQHFMLFE